MSEAKKGKPGPWRGKKRPEVSEWLGEHQFKKGQESWLKGKKGYTNAGTYKNGHKGMKGESNPAWIDGRMAKHNAWRKAIFERDNYTCQLCEEKGKYLNAHHLKEQSLYPKIKNDLDNGITLCRRCHLGWHIQVGHFNQHSLVFNNGAFKGEL